MVNVSNPAPMCNFEQLQRYVGKNVRMVASVENVNGNQAQVKAADGGMVNVALREPANFDTKFVMFEGRVESPNSLAESGHTNFGNNFGEWLMTGWVGRPLAAV